MAVALNRSLWIPITCVVFVLVNALFMAGQFYWLNLLPVVLIISWAMVYAVDNLLIFVSFAAPLSINLEELSIGGIGISLPTEPIMVGLTVLFLFKLGLERSTIDKRVWEHPLTYIILLQIGWMLLCTITSSMPLVSIKFVIARVWFVTTMFFMVTRLFRNEKNVHRFIWAYMLGLSVVVVYTLVRHWQNQFDQDSAHWVMTPFYKDHTGYGAILAFFLPYSVNAIAFPGFSFAKRVMATVLFVVLATGLVFSYTRAAWVSLIGAFVFFLIMRFRIPLWVLIVGALVLGGIAWSQQEQITIAMHRNTVESSNDLGEHVKSISNISSDASNLERINRWNSALRMFLDRPLMGFGPGTYMFQYAPYQASADRTIISTNFGVQGNAHSEYLGPLAEQGLFGLLLMLALVLTSVAIAMRLYVRMPKGADRRLLLATFLGLVTYYLHGGLNNFLDTDKASVPFWAFTALIVLLDIRHRSTTGSGVENDTLEVG